MKTARIVVLGIAGVAGLAAMYLVSVGDRKPAPVAPPVVQLPTVEVLVAKSDIGLGQSVKPEDVQWQRWPAETASSAFIRHDTNADAMNDVIGSIARAPFIVGEPIREQKLVKANGSGFMAAILPTGMRAISTEISPETGAGGFILPNDRVDVILSRRDKNPDQQQGSRDIITTEILLSNVRVLAIDQAPKEKDGNNSLIGKTVTLELKPEQAETLARARQSGTLALALRSIADVNEKSDETTDHAPKRGESIRVVRFGIPSSQTTQK
ncbi:Flp pilus assembly protein CpaB [Bradyrhizobium quebecense]|uniref:Flp pilus assembly protein CpaB n=2 Tax=Bradyrhizobium quebecense TaxID=2748629 RepID=A0ABS3MVL6_9BRAD|nr:Flp pilus assembly protein CpaB [Bradyrhizobium quebecense]UGY03188.1 Flp pilus assembly protein CpaB [Bradyrhizobium quebecense]